MTRATRARQVARAAAYGGGGLVGAGGAAFALLVAQAKLARRTIGVPTTGVLSADGRYLPPGHTTGEQGQAMGAELRLAMLGDSGAAGFGVEDPADTTGALIAVGIAERLHRPVELRRFAVVGAQSGDLDRQVTEAIAFGADVAVVMVGANDVTHRVLPATSVRLLQGAVRRLRQAGIEVVVGTCPDLGTVRPIAPPLRYVARRWSRWLAAAQTIAVVEEGGRSVALADLLGSEFAADVETMFGPDGFHPSSAGYRRVAEVLMPSVSDALGPAVGDEEPSAAGRVDVMELSQAAAEAVESGGTEVVAADPDVRPRPLLGRLRIRRRGL